MPRNKEVGDIIGWAEGRRHVRRGERRGHVYWQGSVKTSFVCLAYQRDLDRYMKYCASTGGSCLMLGNRQYDDCNGGWGEACTQTTTLDCRIKR